MQDPVGILTQKKAARAYSVPRKEWKISSVWWLLFLSGCLLYGLTAQRDVNWQDSGAFQWRALVGDYYGDHGLAVSHPLLIFAGQVLKTVPIGTLEARMNLFSSVGMALAIANFTVLVVFITGRLRIGVVFGIMLAVCHAVWWLATITETYAWVMAGLTAELYFLARLLREPKWSTLAILAFISGLGLSMHDFALLPLPVYAVTALVLVYRKRIPRWSLAAATGFYLLGASPILSLVANTALAHGSLEFAIKSLLFGNAEERVVSATFLSPYTVPNVALAALSFVNPALPLAVLGWVWYRKTLGSAMALAFGSVTFIEILFIVKYPSQDQFTSMLPSLTMVYLSAAIGAFHIERISRRWGRIVFVLCMVTIGLMPILYGTMPTILRMAGYEVHRARMLPFRDEASYWLTPWKQNEHSAQMFAEAALAQASPNGMILSDGTALWPMLITRQSNRQYEGVGLQLHGSPLPDYNVARDKFRDVLGLRPLYIVSPVPGYVPDGFGELLKEATFSRNAGEALYRIQLNKTVPQQ